MLVRPAPATAHARPSFKGVLRSGGEQTRVEPIVPDGAMMAIRYVLSPAPVFARSVRFTLDGGGTIGPQSTPINCPVSDLDRK